MNLTKLLPIGRCVKQSKTVFGKYKLSQQTLPKFASTVRPSTSSPIAKALSEKANFVAVSEVPPTPKVEMAAQNSIQTESPKSPIVVLRSAPDETKKLPPEKIAVQSEAPVEPVLKKEAVTLGARLGEKISAIKKKLRPARSKKKSGAAVQTEWALGVQVARNDLSDADLEVVASKKIEPKNPASAHSSTPKLAGLNQAKSYGYRWIKKTAGLFSPSSPFEKSAPVEATETPAEVKNSSELVGRI